MDQEIKDESGDSFSGYLDRFVSFLLDVKPLKRKRTIISFSTADVIASLFFLFMGMMLRMFRIQYPKTPLYGEHLYGNRINEYSDGFYSNTMQPAFPYIMTYFFARLADYKKNINFLVDYRDEKNFEHMIYITFRITNAFFSALCVPISYILLRMLDCAPFTSFLGGIMVLVDPLLIVQGRNCFGHGYAQFFQILSVLFMIIYSQCGTWLTFIIEGIVFGFSVQTSIFSIGMLLLACFYQIDYEIVMKNRKIDSQSQFRVFLLLFIAFLTSILINITHILLCPYFSSTYEKTAESIKSCLVDKESQNWDIFNSGSSLLYRAIAHMFTSKYDDPLSFKPEFKLNVLKIPFSYGSLLKYHNSENRSIICNGNVFVMIPVFCFEIVSLVTCILSKEFFKLDQIFLYSYIIMLLPCKYLYQYHLPLMLGILNICVCINRASNKKFKGFAQMFMLTLSVVGFLLWSSWCYGLVQKDDFLYLFNIWK